MSDPIKVNLSNLSRFSLHELVDSRSPEPSAINTAISIIEKMKTDLTRDKVEKEKLTRHPLAEIEEVELTKEEYNYIKKCIDQLIKLNKGVFPHHELGWLATKEIFDEFRVSDI